MAADPAAAFEALRAEVAQLRAALEGLPTTAPDYSPTLADIAESLAVIEARPTLRLTPQDLASQVRQAAEPAQQQGPGGSWRPPCSAWPSVSTGREQIRQVAIMTAVGAVAGVIVWVCLSGRSRARPAGWHVPERMAAATLRLDRWSAAHAECEPAERERNDGRRPARRHQRRCVGRLPNPDCPYRENAAVRLGGPSRGRGR